MKMVWAMQLRQEVLKIIFHSDDFPFRDKKKVKAVLALEASSLTFRPSTLTCPLKSSWGHDGLFS